MVLDCNLIIKISNSLIVKYVFASQYFTNVIRYKYSIRIVLLKRFSAIDL